MAKIQESQLRQALEYFNLPESIWPTGLHVRHTHGKACDKLADDLTITIKDEFTRMAQQDRCDEATISRGIVAVEKKREEKKRIDYVFRRQFNEKPNNIPGGQRKQIERHADYISTTVNQSSTT
ncbi:MAG: hypothetical protein FRX49_09260 [Trebouxia sp. A1-2]|nr:MAG: hypothetical protein FRX49_09260 [Trebouxia sp. A1-2]